MIISKCPLRISLVGGGTDHPKYLEKYGSGSVISFPCNLNVYATVNRDVDGLNHKGKYVINYTRREEVDSIHQIENQLVRECLLDSGDSPLYVALTSDIASHGSGLASSSAYIMALVAATSPADRNPHAIAFLSCYIERKFNPEVGLQDFYGSCYGGIKRIDFSPQRAVASTYFPSTTCFSKLSMFLIPTGICRNSTDILKTVDVDKCHIYHMNDVSDMEIALIQNNTDDLLQVIKNGWRHKKSTSPLILGNPDLIELDKQLEQNKLVLAHKLCGAGNGGYFLVFTAHGTNPFPEKYNAIPISIAEEGLTTARMKIYKPKDDSPHDPIF